MEQAIRFEPAAGLRFASTASANGEGNKRTSLRDSAFAVPRQHAGVCQSGRLHGNPAQVEAQPAAAPQQCATIGDQRRSNIGCSLRETLQIERLQAHGRRRVRRELSDQLNGGGRERRGPDAGGQSYRMFGACAHPTDGRQDSRARSAGRPFTDERSASQGRPSSPMYVISEGAAICDHRAAHRRCRTPRSSRHAGPNRSA